jgi:hypothetical protein
MHSFSLPTSKSFTPLLSHAVTQTLWDALYIVLMCVCVCVCVCVSGGTPQGAEYWARSSKYLAAAQEVLHYLHTQGLASRVSECASVSASGVSVTSSHSQGVQWCVCGRNEVSGE